MLELEAGFFLGHAAAFQDGGDDGDDAGEPVFEDVVGGAAFHAFDGGFLIEGDGEDDDGDVGAAGFGHGDGVEAIVAGEGIVGEDEVRREGVEGLSEGFASGDAVGFAGELHSAELSEDQLLVGL